MKIAVFLSVWFIAFPCFGEKLQPGGTFESIYEQLRTLIIAKKITPPSATQVMGSLLRSLSECSEGTGTTNSHLLREFTVCLSSSRQLPLPYEIVETLYGPNYVVGDPEGEHKVVQGPTVKVLKLRVYHVFEGPMIAWVELDLGALAIDDTGR